VELLDGKYLTFSLGNEDYGIPILKVREIIGMMEITHVPKTPNFIQGVVNLRGKIIPIMDLRKKFSMKTVDYTERTCIIVVEILFGSSKKQMGVVVDTVSEVVNISRNEIETTLDYGAKVEGDFLLGMGKIKDRVVMLLNIDKIISSEEMSALLDSEPVNNVISA